MQTLSCVKTNNSKTVSLALNHLDCATRASSTDPFYCAAIRFAHLAAFLCFKTDSSFEKVNSYLLARFSFCAETCRVTLSPDDLFRIVLKTTRGRVMFYERSKLPRLLASLSRRLLAAAIIFVLWCKEPQQAAIRLSLVDGYKCKFAIEEVVLWTAWTRLKIKHNSINDVGCFKSCFE